MRLLNSEYKFRMEKYFQVKKYLHLQIQQHQMNKSINKTFQSFHNKLSQP